MGISYTEQMRRKIEELSSGGVITVDMFPRYWPRNAVTRALSRLAKEGLIERVKRGVYSKTKETRFGKVSSAPIEVLAKEVEGDENKCFGGLFLFNNLGLTTQVPNTIEILNNKSSYKITIGETTVRYVRIRPKIDRTTKRYIAILEVLKNAKTISDSSAEKTYEWIIKEIKTLEEKRLKDLVKISLDYPPLVRALLGNILQTERRRDLAKRLRETLNANSTYRVGQIASHLRNISEWRLKIEVA